MLIKDLPEPIMLLAQKRCHEFCISRKILDSYSVKSVDELNYAFVYDETYEKVGFWDSIEDGDFTPYYAMYRLPEKWCIKCLPEWLDRKGKVINNDWYRCVKSIKDQLFGDDCSEYYHSNSIIDSVKKEGYTEITLSDWLAANPEKKEDAELNKIYNLEGFVKLENKECVIPEELNKMKSPQFDPINKPKHYNSHPSGIECIEITQHHNYCIGNSIKYLWRQGLKDGESNIKDLMKARKCIDLEIERIKKFENSGK